MVKPLPGDIYHLSFRIPEGTFSDENLLKIRDAFIAKDNVVINDLAMWLYGFFQFHDSGVVPEFKEIL